MWHGARLSDPDLGCIFAGTSTQETYCSMICACLDHLQVTPTHPWQLTAASAGIGLGMTIVKSIVARMVQADKQTNAHSTLTCTHTHRHTNAHTYAYTHTHTSPYKVISSSRIVLCGVREEESTSVHGWEKEHSWSSRRALAIPVR
jgi:hypothetical protein